MLHDFGNVDKQELRSETLEERKWVNRVPELRTGGKLAIGRSFLLIVLFSSLVRSLLLLRILARYKWCQHGFYHLRISVNGRWHCPVRRMHREVTLTREMGDGTCGFVRLCTWDNCSITPFHSLLLYWLLQPRRSAPKEGDTLTGAGDPGRVTAIVYSGLATSLRSLPMILPIYIHPYYRSHPRLQPCSYNYHPYTYEAERRHTCPYTV